jgi:hypothetical protein
VGGSERGTPHFSTLTRKHMWQQMTGDMQKGTALLAQVVSFAQSVGGPARGKIVGRAMEALVTSKKTGTSEIDIIVEYVKCCRARGSSLGGLGGQKMWDFQYLCQFTQRDPSSFCKDLMARAILARAGISEASVTARAQTRMWVKTGPSSTRQPLLLSSFS